MGGWSVSPIPGPPAQVSSVRKINPHNFWLQKTVGIESVKETARAPVLKELTHRLTHTYSLPLSSSTGVQFEKAPVAHREKLQCLASW